MLLLGLTGGIGAGKSAVAKRLVRRGAVLIDSDRLAREVVAAGTDGLAEVVAAFGPEIVGADGELDRPALGARVFGDEPARRALEAIIHPRVRARSAELVAAAAPDAIVVNDVPLLVEVGLAPSYQLVVVVEADRAVRVRRLADTRGMTVQQAEARIAAQATDDVRRAAADAVLRNDGGLAGLDRLVERLWRERLVPYEENLRSGRRAPVDPGLRIVPPDPTWPAQAERLIARIRYALGADVVVEHIGSTAVPGLPAEDVIDLMLVVRSPDDADAVAGRLGRIGLPRVPVETRGLPGESRPEQLHGGADPDRAVNLHVRVAGSPGWRLGLLMRDHLRAVPERRDAYAEVRRALMVEHADGGPAEPRFAAEAERWARQTGWEPGT